MYYGLDLMGFKDGLQRFEKQDVRAGSDSNLVFCTSAWAQVSGWAFSVKMYATLGRLPIRVFITLLGFRTSC